MTFDDFGKSGRLGCGKCYQTFRTEMSDLLRKIHGSPKHRGKRLAGEGEYIGKAMEETQLREDLKKAVENEEFEKAASIRDQIRSLTGAE
jgi:protein arginine kinase activator